MTIIDMDKIGEVLNTKADIDLNNTGVFSTSEGGGVSLTSSTPADASGKEVTSADFFQSNLLNYTTNRILEIPQDIKLELNNGTLTLKAGSKVYVSNGPGVFTESSVTTDRTVVSNTLTGKFFIFSSSSGLFAESMSTQSGSTFPSSATSGNKFYNTTENKLYRYNGTEWQPIEYSLPLAIVTLSSGSVTSIDQVFNGFGYIGSTVFALPGVKVQIPNGRNEDGTCRSIIATVGSVKTTTRTDSVTTSIHWYLLNNHSLFSSSVVNFDVDKNIYVSSTGIVTAVEIANGYLTSGKITSFEPYTVDSVLNSSLSNLTAAGEAKLKSNIQLVDEAPSNPESGVLYCIPEK